MLSEAEPLPFPIEGGGELNEDAGCDTATWTSGGRR